MLLILLYFFLSGCQKSSSPINNPEAPPSENNQHLAGFRASRILSNYPNHEFPSPDYWTEVAGQIAALFDSTAPGGIWIVSLYQQDGYTRVNFPVPGQPDPFLLDTPEEQNDRYLDAFDAAGVKVFLQVEPGAVRVDTLIHLVLSRYRNHPSVIGFGVDVEWYQTQVYPGGKKVTDEETQRWEAKVKSFNEQYRLFLKHYSASWMPPQYRGDILFVDDSQNFIYSSHPFETMVNEFYDWGRAFSPNPVAFQVGYPADRSWWANMKNPVQQIGTELMQHIPNMLGFFWVDFTITEIYPVN